MNVLVTGAAGFIGFHTARSLLDAGHAVVGLDNFSPYYAVSLKRDRHARLTGLPNYTGVEGDITDTALLDRLFSRHRFDRVCHLAAQPGVRYSISHPFAYQKSNGEGFLAVIEACRHHAVPRLVYASSSSVYGGNRRLPFRESDPVDTPISLYAATKKSNELMAHVYSHLYGLQTLGMRLFTVYGPWGRPDMALWTFTESMLRGAAIPVYNHGDMRRDFTYIDDIVAGLVSALCADGLPSCDVINLGNHHAESLMDMIGILGRALGVEPRLDLLPMQPGDLPETYADIDKARRLLGFLPRTALAEGIQRFVAWYRGYQGNPS